MSLFYTNETNTLKNHKEKVGDIMTSLKTANRRVGSFFAVAALVLATITPGLVPAFASAAQITERSVTLSSSSRAATGVQYDVAFTPTQTAGAVVLNFCSNSPLIGTECDAPAGFSAASVSAAGFTDALATADEDNNTLVLTGSIAASATTIEVTGVANPTAAGSLYVRIVTYDTGTNALTYEADDLKSGSRDTGSAAVSITDTVGVSGAVLETMTFCVSGAPITTENCVTTTTPTLKLGQTNGDVVALSSQAVSEGSIYSQISTNAVSGAVVNLKSNAAACGGLLRAGAPSECNIAPATNGITQGNALFGLKVAAAANPGTGTNSNGAFAAASSGAFYSDSIFKINFDEDEELGVTSPYGDPVLDTANAPASNKNAQLTFGASISNNTPAGLYSADLSLIATGKF